MTDRELMEKALKAMDYTYTVFGLTEQGKAALSALRERLAQPEHEPATKTGDLRAMKDEFWKQPEPDGLSWLKKDSNYFSQPQRQPLSDEQYFEIGQRHGLSSYKVEQIHKELEEAAHGIKGEA